MADIEDVIRGYQPLGPPADLRGRIVTKRRRSRRAWLLIAASGFLALTCELLSAREHALLSAEIIGVGRAVHEQQIRALARTLGDDATAAVQAELIVNMQEQENAAP